MPLAGSKRLYRRTTMAIPDGSSFLGAAVALCVAGALLDTVGN